MLTDFFDHFVTATKNKQDLTKEGITKCLEEAIQLYAVDMNDNTQEIEHVNRYLASLKEQLEQVGA